MAQKKTPAKAAKKSAAAGKSTKAEKAVAAKPATAKKKASVASKTPASAKAKTTVKKAPAKKTASKATAKPAAKKAVKAAAPKPAKKAAAKPAAAKKAPAGTAKAAAKPRAKVAAAAKATAPVKTAEPRAAQKPVGTPMTPKEVAAKVAGQRKAAAAAAGTAPVAAAPKKPVNQRGGFKVDEFVVYPAHGVGQVVGIEEQEIAGLSLELFVIMFEKDKMTLRVPTGKCEDVGMRKLAEEPVVTKAMTTLKGKARVKRTMWSRRAQEYEAKINSGDLVQIAEVVRDLFRSETQPEQSYSERQLYEQALDRMSREIAAVEKLDERSAVQRVTDVLQKSAKGRRAAAEAAEDAEAAAAGDGEKAA